MIAIGCDHAAYDFKVEILEYLKAKGYDVKDLGVFAAERANYPDYAHLVCETIQSGECDKGILICGTGIGMSIAANKHKGIRAALCSESLSAELSRKHNDANVLCLGARVLGPELAKHIIDAWLVTEFEGGRHQDRVDLISRIESEEN
ncbi:MAG: ribose 5-phosphate isomerase B [Eubacteriales bacterium]|nr:ribose 5-phosphate isomerase B [Eubacteriales bacterium]MDD4328141.1 ribose 5-phosphate isomerase B [Eubacteriales bacterium]NCU26706.1 ribose 5-phosphate isomerase B [Candidatus Nomurabacteria bacterium]